MPATFHVFDVEDKEDITLVVVLECQGRRYAKAVWEPYPEGCPSQLAVEHAQAATTRSVLSSYQTQRADDEVTACAIAAALDVHSIKTEHLVGIMGAPTPDAANALLIVAAGDHQVAAMLAKQAGHPTLDFPASPPNPGSQRAERVHQLIREHLPSINAMQAITRHGRA